jgi:hypothetical protein
MDAIALPAGSIDLSFEKNAYIRFVSCGAVFYLVKCPLCPWTLEDPLFVDFLEKKFGEHIRSHEAP